MRRHGTSRSVVLVAAAAMLLSLVLAPAAAAEPADPSRDVFGGTILEVGPKSGPIAATTKAAGLTWVRYRGLDWARAEPRPGQLDEKYLTTWQTGLANLGRQGLRAEVVLFGTPSYAQAVSGSSCGPIKPEFYDDFAAFSAKMVQRYAKAPYNVTHWEVWNEPDAPTVMTNTQPYGCWGRPDDTRYYGGRAFGDMLKVVYPAIKRADPKATVLFGGLLMGCDANGRPCGGADQPGTKFLAGALAAGAGGSFDELPFHVYPTWARLPAAEQFDADALAHGWKDTGGFMLGKLHALRGVLGDLDKPISMNEGALLWCPPVHEDPRSWCHKAGITDPQDDYLQLQANHILRFYTRAWANGIEHADWFLMENGGWRGGGLLNRGDNSKRPAYHALTALTARLRGATYVGGTVVSGRPVPDPVEDYRFCKGSTEYRLLWTNDNRTPKVHLQAPTGIASVTDKFGKPVRAGDSLSVGFEPTVVERDLGRPCVAGRPATTAPAIADLTVHRAGEHWRQVAVVGGGSGTVFTRTSADAAGRQWPKAWTRTPAREAFAGPAAGQAPPTGAIDALTTWQPPGQNGPRQEVFAGGGVWRRDAANPDGSTWGSWSNTSLAKEWGGDSGGPPADRVDAVTIRPGPQAGQWRQSVVAGNRLHIRDSADGLTWPRTWQSMTLAGAWGGDRNHPPTDRIDALTVQSTTDDQGRARWRQTVVAGEVIWSRLSTDERGAAWPRAWDSSTLAASWAAGHSADSPPVWAQTGPYKDRAPFVPAQPEPRSAPDTTTPDPAPPQPTLPAEDDARPIGAMPFTGAQVAGGLVLGLALLAAGTALLFAGRRGQRARRQH